MKLLRLAASLTTVLALAVPGVSQCLTPDGLDPNFAGGCTGAWMNQSQKAFQQTALGICWRDCGVDATQTFSAVWGKLNPVMTIIPLPPIPSCGWYQTRLQLYAGSSLAWTGAFHVTYSRTWAETPMPGQFIQVWRYLVNGDLQPVIPMALPTGNPACAVPNGNKVRFTGYIDYAHDCSGVTQRAWMITHACDAIDHAVGGPRAGVFHPSRYYSFAGPSAGFVVGAGSTLEAGGASSECVRKWDALAMPARCNLEEPLLFAAITPQTMTCMCGVGPSNWYEGMLQIAGAFGSTVFPFPGSAPFRSFPVGQWTNPAVFPGVEEVRWNCNEGIYSDCSSFVRQEFYFGATTAGGYPAMTIGSSSMPPMPLSSVFVDQANSVILPANIAIRNRPYRSDHIFNLNF